MFVCVFVWLAGWLCVCVVVWLNLCVFACVCVGVSFRYLFVGVCVCACQFVDFFSGYLVWLIDCLCGCSIVFLCVCLSHLHIY